METEIIKLTAGAIDKVKGFSAKNNQAEGKLFRVYVQGGGCSGFQYGFTFDEKREGDAVVAAGDIQVLIDPTTAPYLQGAQIDFVEDLTGSGFVVQNPNAKGSCGCGHSFSA